MQEGDAKKNQDGWHAFMVRCLEERGTQSVRIRKVLFEEAKSLCDETGVSVNDYVSAAVAQRLWRDLNDQGDGKE